MEMWKEVPIEPYKQYYMVNEYGEVFSKRRGRTLKPKLSNTGYFRVTLSVNGTHKTVGVHRLVALAFIENPTNKETVNHINECKTDNSVSNLEWATRREQNVHGTRIERAVKNTDWKKRTQKIDYKKIAEKHDYQRSDMCNRKRTVVTKDGVVFGHYLTQREASRATGVSRSRVSECVSGKIKSCRGFVFKEEDSP